MICSRRRGLGGWKRCAWAGEDCWSTGCKQDSKRRQEEGVPKLDEEAEDWAGAQGRTEQHKKRESLLYIGDG